MAISERLKFYLHKHRVEFDLIPHPHTHSSTETAETAHVSGDCLAKAVVVKNRGQYTMVVVPSSQHVDLELLRKQLDHDVELATEAELGTLFPDCDMGAIPPIGAAYDMETVWDCRLAEQPVVYFEAGDHEELVRVSATQFSDLVGKAGEGRFAHTA